MEIMYMKVQKKDIESLDHIIEQTYGDDDYKYHTDCSCGKHNYFSSNKYYRDGKYLVKCPNCKKVTELLVW